MFFKVTNLCSKIPFSSFPRHSVSRFLLPFVPSISSPSCGPPLAGRLSNLPGLFECRAQCVVSLALRVALERTVHKNVSAIMEGRVMPPQASVAAVQDTQGNGKGQSCILFVMSREEKAQKVQRTPPPLCVCDCSRISQSPCKV